MQNPEDGKESLKSKAVKGILWGGFSNGAQQIIGLVFGIFLGRNLSDTEYGTVGILTIFSLLASKIQESGFFNALANKKDVSHKDYNAVFWINILLSFLLYIVLFFAAPYIAQFYQMPELTHLARILFLGFVIGSFGAVHNAYLFKNLKVKERALATTISTIFAGILAVCLVHFNFSYWSLAYQSIAYNASFTLICIYFSSFRPSFDIDLSPIKELWKFSNKILASNIIDIINSNILTLYLGKIFSKDVVGNYNQADKWSKMPQGIIANMSHGFAQPLLAQFQNDPEQQNLIFLKLLRFIAFFTFPSLGLLAIIANEFIIITITDKWLNAVPILQILCINAAFLPFINYFSNYFLSKGKSQIYMRYNIVYGIIQLAILFLLRDQELTNIVWTISIFSAIWTFIWQISVSKHSKIPYSTLSKIISIPLLIAITAATTAYFLSISMSDNLYLSSLLKIFIFSITYISIHFVLKSVILFEIIQIAKKKIWKQ